MEASSRGITHSPPSWTEKAWALLAVLTHDALCVRVHDPAEYVFASQSRAPQGRLKSPKFKSGLQTDSDLVVRRRLCKGILRFRGAKCPKFSRVAPPAGAAMRLTAGAARFFVQQMLYRLS